MLDFLPEAPHLPAAARDLSAACGRTIALSSAEHRGRLDVSVVELVERRGFMPRVSFRKRPTPEHRESLARPSRHPRPAPCRKLRCLIDEPLATAASAR
ncbi:hypothetical protein BE04_08565 [Sorangium cellulosum]|uniref:Uncharacterized protein n=1 Tax=Sorangium cellulosum TaxID=56 RepID=A0A150PM09_SORCE|nr:hypothetical protein BE04_08565 [Sorangium cellulosum]